MADEPRRSGRATKGQHTKNDDVPDGPPSKRKGQSKSSKRTASDPIPDDEGEIIRCICGQYEEEEELERDMICCDQCSAWQHNDCMELPFAKGEVPDQYFCEQCRPEEHKELLAKIARGEKPWEEAARRREEAAEELKARKKKGGKRGRKSRPSDVKSEASEDVTANGTPARHSLEANGGNIQASGRRGSGQKRKLEAHEVGKGEEEEPKAKIPRVSTQPTKGQDTKTGSSPAQKRKSSAMNSPSRQASKSESAQVELVGSAAELTDGARRNVASALVKLFVDQAIEAQKRGSYKVQPGKTPKDVGQRLGLEVENALYQNLCGGSGEPGEAYKVQMRTILFNVKKNPALRDRLLVGSLSAYDLSMMKSEDMASKELQQKDAEIKKEAEKQHTIVQEVGPRIRRTHKGEEFVGDDQNVASESIFSSAPARRRESVIDTEAPTATTPRQMSPPSPTTAESYQLDQHEQSRREKPHPIDTRAPPRASIGGERKSSSAFNIQDVWSSVHSPDAEKPRFSQEPQIRQSSATFQDAPPGTVQADAEIDQLLKDEDVESPPYSPKDFDGDGIVWRGKLAMNTVGEFNGTAKHVGGADLSGRIPWSQLVPSTLSIDGRIDIERANTYLCGLRFSQTTDVSVVAISAPESPNDRAQFDKLFNYFSERKRYGVIGKHPLPMVKDTYIIPVEAGVGKKPEFIELLENNAIEDPTPERLLLCTFVIKSTATSSAQATPKDQNPASITASPMAANNAQSFGSPAQQQTPYPIPATGHPAGSHISPTPSFIPPNLPPYMSPAGQQQQYSPPPPPNQASYLPLHSQIPLTGAAAAAQILGPHLSKTPAVEQLLVQVPHVGVPELNVVRDILNRTPDAANDIGVLTKALVDAKNGQ